MHSPRPHVPAVPSPLQPQEAAATPAAPSGAPHKPGGGGKQGVWHVWEQDLFIVCVLFYVFKKILWVVPSYVKIFYTFDGSLPSITHIYSRNIPLFPVLLSSVCN